MLCRNQVNVCVCVSLPLHRHYHDAMDSYKTVSIQVKNLNQFVHLLGRIMNDRHKVYTELRMYLEYHLPQDATIAMLQSSAMVLTLGVFFCFSVGIWL